MNITNITDDYNDTITPNCTDSENDIDIIIPALLFTLLIYVIIVFMFNILYSIYFNQTINQ